MLTLATIVGLSDLVEWLNLLAATNLRNEYFESSLLLDNNY